MGQICLNEREKWVDDLASRWDELLNISSEYIDNDYTEFDNQSKALFKATMKDTYLFTKRVRNLQSISITGSNEPQDTLDDYCRIFKKVVQYSYISMVSFDENHYLEATKIAAGVMAFYMKNGNLSIYDLPEGVIYGETDSEVLYYDTETGDLSKMLEWAKEERFDEFDW